MGFAACIRHRPQLDEIREPYIELLRQRYGEDARFYYWPERRGLREIKMDLSSWFEKGFPFTFMLYSNAEGRPRVRVLMYRDNYKRHAESLAGWPGGSTMPPLDRSSTRTLPPSPADATGAGSSERRTTLPTPRWRRSPSTPKPSERPWTPSSRSWSSCTRTWRGRSQEREGNTGVGGMLSTLATLLDRALFLSDATPSLRSGGINRRACCWLTVVLEVMA